jgi:hypothetical protein
LLHFFEQFRAAASAEGCGRTLFNCLGSGALLFRFARLCYLISKNLAEKAKELPPLWRNEGAKVRIFRVGTGFGSRFSGGNGLAATTQGVAQTAFSSRCATTTGVVRGNSCPFAKIRVKKFRVSR